MSKRTIRNISMDYTNINLSVSEPEIEQLQFSSIASLISRARLEEKPLIIVEGKDDLYIYESFIQKANIKASIRAIETIPGYGEGCTQVKKFIEDAQDEIKKTKENELFLLGIIDRDASYFRKEIKKRTKCLFVLKAYSFESHFVSKNHINYALNRFLTSTSDINNEIVDYIYRGFEDNIEMLYYLSLEALKNACNRKYSGLIGFGVNYGYISNNQQIVSEVLLKKEKLDKYSELRKIPYLDLTIIKGKWLLDMFIEKMLERIKFLSKHCIHDDLINGQVRCSFCANGIPDKCSWTPKKSHDKVILKNLVLQYFDDYETFYIIERLKKMGSTV